MDLLGLHYHCTSCDHWYTKESIPVNRLVDDDTDFLRQEYFCTCGNEVLDAYETNTVTPYQSMQLKFLQQQVDMYERLIDELNREMTRIDRKTR